MPNVARSVRTAHSTRRITSDKPKKPRPQVIILRSRVSDGARALKDALNRAGVRTILTDKTQFKFPYTFVNWNMNDARVNGRLLNAPAARGPAINKLTAFNRLKAAGFPNLPDYWTEPPTDEQRGKSIVLERTTVTGQSGEGINVKRPGEALGRAAMYVRYVPKEIELRVHVLNGKAVAVQQKRKVEGREQTDNEKLIRNHDHGWVFAVNNVSEQAAEAAKPVAVEACRILGLDFGAVDIIIPKKGGVPIFLEVNTSPGLESETVLNAYVEELRGIVGQL